MIHPLVEYADERIVEFWTPEAQVRIERGLWWEVLGWMVQTTDLFPIEGLGLRLAAYELTQNMVDLASIKTRERVTRHDVKARIEEWNALATSWYRMSVDPDAEPLELIHLGMTSADVVDNVSLIKIRWSVRQLHILCKDVALRTLMDRLPFRGIKGPVGTQQDMVDLLGSKEAADELDRHLACQYGFKQVINNCGQVYQRSLDFMVASIVLSAVARHGAPGPWLTLLRGYLTMIGEYSGDQWNEGDVSTSVTRRVALPGLFMAASAALSGVEL
jgi:adenylosuccinate lyase